MLSAIETTFPSVGMRQCSASYSLHAYVSFVCFCCYRGKADSWKYLQYPPSVFPDEGASGKWWPTLARLYSSAEAGRAASVGHDTITVCCPPRLSTLSLFLESRWPNYYVGINKLNCGPCSSKNSNKRAATICSSSHQCDRETESRAQ